jgi:hypothetical protein
MQVFGVLPAPQILQHQDLQLRVQTDLLQETRMGPELQDLRLFTAIPAAFRH